MNTRLLSLSLSLLVAAVPVAPAWADAAADAPPQRPLNLTLPREVRQLPSITFDGVSADPVARNLSTTQVRDGRSDARLPYGSGYEARQRDVGQGARTDGTGYGAGQRSGGSGAGTGSSPAGATGGGKGRGGMGRGR